MKTDKLVVVDARQMAGTRKGVGRYLCSFLDALKCLDHNWHVRLLFSKELPADIPDGYESLQLTASNNYFWEQITLPRYLKRTKPDLFFAPGNSLPLRLPSPTVMILHDAMMFQPELSLPAARRYYGYQAWCLRRVAHKCKRIITVSNFSASEIVRFIGPRVAPLLTVITEGVEQRFITRPETAVLREFLDHYSLQQGYMLHFASAVPRKGTRLLLEALARLKSDGLVLPALFLPGVGSNDAVVTEWLKEFGIQAIVASYLSEAEMSLAYAGAGVLLYPSLWEGFGLPLLEGMAMGLPVIATDATSIPELAGDAAWLIKPGDVGDLAEKLRRYIDYPEQARELSDRGRIRAREFTWEKTATAVLDVWNSVAI